MGIQEVKRKRFEYLYKLWEATGGDVDSTEDAWELGKTVKMDMKETQKIVSYLMGENLLDMGESGGTVKITSRGVKEVEKSIKSHENETNPERASEKITEEKDLRNTKGNSSSNGGSIFTRQVNVVAIESYAVGIGAGAACIFLAVGLMNSLSLYVLALSIILGAISITCLLKPEKYEQVIDSIFGSSENDEPSSESENGQSRAAIE
jgi:hypothetical protein